MESDVVCSGGDVYGDWNPNGSWDCGIFKGSPKIPRKTRFSEGDMSWKEFDCAATL